MPEQIRTLVVEDEPEAREGIVDLLGRDPEIDVVGAAGSGPDAVAAVAEQAPELLLLDVQMPGLDGFGVLRARRQQGLAPDMRILVLTCKTAERDYVRGWELGADECVTKPFDPEQVVHKVNDLLASPLAALHERREAELQKAELLDRLESAFSRPNR